MRNRMIMAWHSRDGISPSGWADPRAAGIYAWNEPELYCDLTVQLEQAGMDLAVFGDQLAWTEEDRDAAVTSPRLDPSIMIAAVAAETQRIGLAPGIFPRTCFPFTVARLLSTLDHLSEGRIGWNVLPRINAGTAGLHAIEMLDAATEDELTDEYLRLCIALWESWDADAVVGDWRRGIFADPAKVRQIQFSGRFYSSQGPLNTVPSPQRRPVIIHCVTSARDMCFAGRHAEVVILDGESVADLTRDVANLRMQRRLLGGTGEEIAVLVSVSPAIAASREGAEAVQRLNRIADGQDISICRPVGTVEDVADALEAIQTETDADGFAVEGLWLPQYVSDISFRLLPTLERRGHLRRDVPGATLRERLSWGRSIQA